MIRLLDAMTDTCPLNHTDLLLSECEKCNHCFDSFNDTKNIICALPSISSNAREKSSYTRLVSSSYR